VVSQSHQVSLLTTENADSAAEKAAGEAQAALKTAASAAAAAQARLVSDQVVASAALRHLDAVSGRLSQVGVEMYLGEDTPAASQVDGFLVGSSAAADSAFSQLVVGSATAAATSQLRTARRHVSAADRALASAQRSAAAAAGRVAEASSAATEAASRAMAAAAAAKAAKSSLISALAGTTPGPDGSPTILGSAVLNPAQLAGWFAQSPYQSKISTPISQLASWYVSEGDAQGVRGDLAFAQAVLETGGFTNDDSIRLNNYAGIGHCDSCASGFAFSTPHMGVRAQIQLLATYATPGLTTAKLARPLASAQLAPEDQPIQGTRQTWMSLSLTWATNPVYGQSILGLYDSMLRWALTHPNPSSSASPTVASAAGPLAGPADAPTTPSAPAATTGQQPAGSPAQATDGTSSQPKYPNPLQVGHFTLGQIPASG
jgi:hypothetical protein